MAATRSEHGLEHRGKLVADVVLGQALDPLGGPRLPGAKPTAILGELEDGGPIEPESLAQPGQHGLDDEVEAGERGLDHLRAEARGERLELLAEPQGP